MLAGARHAFLLTLALYALWPAAALCGSPWEITKPASYGPPHSCLAYYPPEAQRANVQGTNVVAFVIDTDGSVRDLRITQSSGSPLLDWATIACAQHWHYIPAKRAGAAVAVEWGATVQYALK